jgi:hypothetical protein
MLKSFWVKAGISGTAAALLVAGFVSVNAQGRNAGTENSVNSQQITQNFDVFTGQSVETSGIAAQASAEAAQANLEGAANLASAEVAGAESMLAQAGNTAQNDDNGRPIGGATVTGGGSGGGAGAGAGAGTGGAAGGGAGGAAAVGLAGAGAAAGAGVAASSTGDNNPPASPTGGF